MDLGFKPEDRTENIRRVGMFLSIDFLNQMEIVKFEIQLMCRSLLQGINKCMSNLIHSYNLSVCVLLQKVFD